MGCRVILLFAFLKMLEPFSRELAVTVMLPTTVVATPIVTWESPQLALNTLPEAPVWMHPAAVMDGVFVVGDSMRSMPARAPATRASKTDRTASVRFIYLYPKNDALTRTPDAPAPSWAMHHRDTFFPIGYGALAPATSFSPRNPEAVIELTFDANPIQTE